jgi:hemolysin activation/secretion protein
MKSFLATLFAAVFCLLPVWASSQDASSPPSNAEQRIFVKEFQFTGNSVIGSDTLAGVIAPSQGKELSLADMKAAADTITVYYNKHGYFLAMAIIPEQDFRSDVVKLHVFEGNLGKVIISGNKDYSTDFLQAYFNRMRREGVIRKNTMERALLLMNKLPNIKVSSVLNAGEEKGTTDIVVTVKEGDIIKANFTIDNFGSQYSRVRAKTGLDFMNRLNRGDSFSLAGIQGLNSDKLHHIIGNFKLPIGANGMTLDVYGLAGNFGVGKEFAALNVQGRASAMGISIARTLFINQQKNTILEVGLDASDSKQDILTFNASTDNIRSLRVSINRNYEGSHGRSLSSFTVQQGLGELLGGMQNESLKSSRSNAGADNCFTKFNLESGRAQSLSPKRSLITRFTSQLSLNNLVVGEQMSIGGADSVRGYPQGEYLGDSGIQANIEARFGLNTKSMEKFQIATFVDFGLVSLKEPTLGQKKSSSITGAGFGFRFNPRKGSFIRADVGFPIGHKPSDKRSASYYMQYIQSSN